MFSHLDIIEHKFEYLFNVNCWEAVWRGGMGSHLEWDFMILCALIPSDLKCWEHGKRNWKQNHWSFSFSLWKLLSTGRPFCVSFSKDRKSERLWEKKNLQNSSPKLKIRQSKIYYAWLLGRWYQQIVDQESDVPSIIFYILFIGLGYVKLFIFVIL